MAVAITRVGSESSGRVRGISAEGPDRKIVLSGSALDSIARRSTPRLSLASRTIFTFGNRVRYFFHEPSADTAWSPFASTASHLSICGGSVSRLRSRIPHVAAPRATSPSPIRIPILTRRDTGFSTRRR